eukprot:5147416-Prymnesium_polylepis.2
MDEAWPAAGRAQYGFGHCPRAHWPARTSPSPRCTAPPCERRPRVARPPHTRSPGRACEECSAIASTSASLARDSPKSRSIVKLVACEHSTWCAREAADSQSCASRLLSISTERCTPSSTVPPAARPVAAAMPARFVAMRTSTSRAISRKDGSAWAGSAYRPLFGSCTAIIISGNASSRLPRYCSAQPSA